MRCRSVTAFLHCWQLGYSCTSSRDGTPRPARAPVLAGHHDVLGAVRAAEGARRQRARRRMAGHGPRRRRMPDLAHALGEPARRHWRLERPGRRPLCRGGGRRAARASMACRACCVRGT